MTLSEYFAGRRGRLTALAAALDYSRSHLCNVAKGAKLASAELARAIERATGGAVTAAEVPQPQRRETCRGAD